MRLPLPADPGHRAFTIAVVCSILLHILLLGSLVWVNTLGMPLYAKKGEPLIVDIAPEKPEEKAPLGDPARPPASPPPAPAASPAEPAAPKQSIPPAPPPKAAAPAKPPPQPEPPKQVAKAPPPDPAPQAKAAPTPAPAPAPPAPAPEPSPQPREAQPAPTPAPPTPTPSPPAPTASETTKPLLGAPRPPSAGTQGSGSQTALAKPSAPTAGMYRNPPGGGGLQGGKGGTAGEPIPLDTPDPNYREYMDKVKQRIYAKWGYPYEAQSRGLQGKLTVEFHIAKDGHLQFIVLRQTSGEEILDTFALTAVKLGQMYPPLPDAMQRDVLPIVGIFVYTLRGPLSVLQSLQ